MAVHERMKNLVEAIARNARGMDESSIRRLIAGLGKAKRVFLCGAGRSGYVAKAFAMRLMHLGYSVYVVGETTTPAITKKDLLIAVSGSGETRSIVGIVEASKRMNADVFAITSNPGSTIGRMSHSVVVIKGRLPNRREKDYLARQLKGGHEPLVPLGTLFELSAMVFFDSLVEELMVLKKRTEDYLKARHTQLE